MEKFPETDFLLSAGDQVNKASNEEQYAGYLEHDVLKSLPMATVIGNHDSGSDAYSEHFNNPNEVTDGASYGATTAGVNYWYVYNNTLFMHINSNNMSAAEHKAFMEKAIAANPDAEWKVVSFHHSLYTVASHAYDGDVLARREQWVPVFDELGVDVVLMGHDHVYARTYMMDGFTPKVTEKVENSVTNPDGILYITANSASGSKFYGIKNETFEYAAVQSQERVPNISNVEVTENSFKITTYRTNDMSVVDTFEIIHEEKSQPEIKPSAPTTDKTTSNNSGSNKSSGNSSSAATNTVKNKVKISEEATPLSGTFENGMTYKNIKLEKGNTLKAEMLNKYYGKNMYLMTFLGKNIGFSIDASSIERNKQDIELESKWENIPGFANGFDTIKVTVAKETKLPFSMITNVNVGMDKIGKEAYIFKKSLVTGSYELGAIMTVNEIGNVILQTKELTDIMILIKQ